MRETYIWGKVVWESEDYVANLDGGTGRDHEGGGIRRMSGLEGWGIAIGRGWRPGNACLSEYHKQKQWKPEGSWCAQEWFVCLFALYVHVLYKGVCQASPADFKKMVTTS